MSPSRKQLQTSDKNSPRGCRITCKNLIRQHEEIVTGEQLITQKGTFQFSFVNEMARLDGKLTEIHDSLEFGEKLFLEIIVKHRKTAREKQVIDLTEVTYIQNDVSSFITLPGKLFTSSTQSSLSGAEGKGLTRALEEQHLQ